MYTTLVMTRQNKHQDGSRNVVQRTKSFSLSISLKFAVQVNYFLDERMNGNKTQHT